MHLRFVRIGGTGPAPTGLHWRTALRFVRIGGMGPAPTGLHCVRRPPFCAYRGDGASADWAALCASPSALCVFFGANLPIGCHEKLTQRA